MNASANKRLFSRLAPPPPWLTHPLTGVGALFFLANTHGSYVFHRVNNYRLFLAGVAVTVLFLLFDLRRREPRPVAWPVALLTALPFLASVPGLFMNQGGGHFNLPLETGSVLALSAMVLLLTGWSDATRSWRPLLLLMALTLSYLGGWAVLEGWVGVESLRSSATPGRVAATLGNANYFAGFLVVLLPLMLVMVRAETGAARLTCLLALLMGGVGLFLTGSRAALAITLVTLTLTGLALAVIHAPPERRRWRRWLPWLLAGGALLLVTLAWLGWQGHLGSRVAALFTIKGWGPRLDPWQAAIAAIRSSPWLGHGPGSSYNLYFQFVAPDSRQFSDNRSFKNAHSEPLEVLEEGGILGFAAWLLVWFILFRAVARVIRHGVPANQGLGLGIAAGWLGFQLHGLFDVASRMVAVELAVVTLIPLALHLEQEATGAGFLHAMRQRFPPRDHRVIMAGLIVAFWLVTPPWLASHQVLTRLAAERGDRALIAQLEEGIDQVDNIYLLHTLAGIQAEMRRTGPLRRTLLQADRVFPHYRDMDFYAVMLAVMLNDLEGAWRLGLAFQKRDLYHEANLGLLARLAASRGEREVFRRQLFLLAEKVAIEQRLGGSEERAQVVVREEGGDAATLEIQLPEGGGVVMLYSPGLIQGVMDDLAASRESDRINPALTATGWLFPCPDPHQGVCKRHRDFARALAKRVGAL